MMRQPPVSKWKSGARPVEARKMKGVRKTRDKVSLVIDNTPIIKAAKGIACIEVLEAPKKGFKRYAGPFYPDEHELLCQMLRRLRKRMDYAVAPDADGLINIYKKPKSK